MRRTWSRGHAREHQALEEELAAFTGRERALLFSTGYMANLGVVSALAGRDECVLADRLNHASLIDGATLCQARGSCATRTPMRPPPQQALQDLPADQLIATDGVFSMDGDIAPLPRLAALASSIGAWLVVDDAHGLGVIWASRRRRARAGRPGHAAVPLLVGTLGKAFGSFGAFVAGDRR